MIIRSKVFKVLLGAGVLILLCSATPMQWRGNSPEKKASPGFDIFLARPAFAQGVDESFLEKQAGISAYWNLGQSINLTKAKAAFRTVERETNSYIVGSVPVPGYEKDTGQDAHCFVHKDGWIVVYYSNSEPTSKIMYWNNWDGKTINNKLQEALSAATNLITGMAPINVKYYHFKYPGANRLLIIANKDSFRLTIPGGLTIHERSYDGGLSIDNQSVGSGPGWISLSQLKPDMPHWISGGNSVVVFVYQEL